MSINEWNATDSFDFALCADLVAEFRDALDSERKAEAKAAQMRGKG